MTASFWNTHVRDNENALAPATSTITTVGTATALALPTGRGDVVIFANNATALIVQGIAAGFDGQRVTIYSIGAAPVGYAHQNGSASAGNRLINLATASEMDTAAGFGVGEFIYDATAARWRMVDFDQGAWITRTFAGGNYTTNGAGGWTVPGAVTDAYYLKGRTLIFSAFTNESTVTAPTGTELRVTLPGGLTANKRSLAFSQAYDNAVSRAGIVEAQIGVTYVRCFADMSQTLAWAAAVTNSHVNFTISVEVQ